MAEAISPKPVRIITAASGFICLDFLRTEMPSTGAITKSVMTRSNALLSNILRASSPLITAVIAYPLSVRADSKNLRIISSSSTNNIVYLSHSLISSLLAR
jgi:hypothetical protein